MPGEVDAARRFHHWCGAAIDRITPQIEVALGRHAAGKPMVPSEMPPARFSLDGRVVKDDWPNFQLDGYGTWLWSLQRHLQKSRAPDLPSRLAPAVRATARYLAEFGTSPCYDVWEEAGDCVHTATLGCVSAGLRAAAVMLDDPTIAGAAESVPRVPSPAWSRRRLLPQVGP